jgi:hypothetical protein
MALKARSNATMLAAKRPCQVALHLQRIAMTLTRTHVIDAPLAVATPPYDSKARQAGDYKVYPMLRNSAS